MLNRALLVTRTIECCDKHTTRLLESVLNSQVCDLRFVDTIKISS